MNEDFYINLLYKQLNGDISQAELQQLQTWIDQSTDNQFIAQGVSKSWEASGQFQTDLDIDLDAEFDFLEKRIAASETPVKQLTPKPAQGSRFSIWRVAAMIAFLLVAGFLTKDYWQNQAPTMASAITTDHSLNLSLADQSKVWVNQHSRLDYFEDLSGKTREVRLSGEAFFDVSKDKDRPFIIHTDQGTVKVLGTSFNVKSIEKEQWIEVEVHSGTVQLTPANSTESLTLTKGMTGTFDVRSGQLKERTDLSPNAAAWHTKRLIFVDAPITEVINDLEIIYGKKIVLQGLSLRDCLFTSTFDNKPLEQVIQTLSGVFGIETIFEQEDTIRLKGGSCQ